MWLIKGSEETGLKEEEEEKRREEEEGGWMKETLFTCCAGVVLQECVQPHGSIPSDEMNEVHVYMIMM